jgi:hypothetical protein
MDHDTGGGEGKTLSLASGGKDEGGHGGSKAKVDGDNFGFDELHGVKDGKAGDDGSPGAVDVEVDGFGAVFFVEVEEDTNDLVG